MRCCKLGLFQIPTPAMIAAQSPDTVKAVRLYIAERRFLAARISSPRRIISSALFL